MMFFRMEMLSQDFFDRVSNFSEQSKILSEEDADIMETIEETVFARKRWIVEKMRAFGFHPVGNDYVLERSFLGGDFKAVLSVTEKGKVTGRVIDIISQDDYYQLRQKNATGAYVNTVRAAYERLLEEIAAACCQEVLFASDQANRLTRCILAHFQVEPDFPWEKEARYQAYGVFRHTSNRKWFALIMRVKRAVLDKNDNSALVDIINLKIEPEQGETLHQLPGVYPAYHMNHRTWISVVLDDTQTDAAIMSWLEDSYRLTE